MTTSPTAKADWQAMLAMASQVNEAALNIGGYLNSLQGELDALAPQWQSEAANTFHSTRTLWDEDARKLQQSLVEIADGLELTAKRYQQADADAIDATRAR